MRFIFVDRIYHIEKEKSARGRKNLAMSEDYFEHHFPFFPVMPGVLMLEAMIELSRWLVLYSTDFRSYCLLRHLRSTKVRNPAQPGDVLDIWVEWREKTETGVLFTGRILLEEKMIAQAEFENRIAEIKRDEESEVLKRSFEFITKRVKDRLKG